MFTSKHYVMGFDKRGPMLKVVMGLSVVMHGLVSIVKLYRCIIMVNFNSG